MFNGDGRSSRSPGARLVRCHRWGMWSDDLTCSHCSDSIDDSGFAWSNVPRHSSFGDRDGGNARDRIAAIIYSARDRRPLSLPDRRPPSQDEPAGLPIEEESPRRKLSLTAVAPPHRERSGPRVAPPSISVQSCLLHWALLAQRYFFRWQMLCLVRRCTRVRAPPQRPFPPEPGSACESTAVLNRADLLLLAETQRRDEIFSGEQSQRVSSEVRFKDSLRSLQRRHIFEQREQLELLKVKEQELRERSTLEHRFHGMRAALETRTSQDCRSVKSSYSKARMTSPLPSLLSSGLHWEYSSSSRPSSRASYRRSKFFLPQHFCWKRVMHSLDMGGIERRHVDDTTARKHRSPSTAMLVRVRESENAESCL